MIKIMWKEVTEMSLFSSAVAYEFLSVCFLGGKGNNHGGLGGLVSSCVLVTAVSKWFVLHPKILVKTVEKVSIYHLNAVCHLDILNVVTKFIFASYNN